MELKARRMVNSKAAVLLTLILIGVNVSGQYWNNNEDNGNDFRFPNEQTEQIDFRYPNQQQEQQPEQNRWGVGYNQWDYNQWPGDFNPYYRPPPPPPCGAPPPGPPPPGPPPPGPPPGCPPPPRGPPPRGSPPRGSPNRRPPPRENWFAPRPPPRDHYRHFGTIYHNMEQKMDSHEYNKSAETEDLHDDFNGRSIVAPGQYPHMAALGFHNENGEIDYKCGGSLISENFVLTAAHCLTTHGTAPDVVKIGDIKLKEWENDVAPQRRRVAKIHLHPLYNDTYYYHDIGLIELNRPVEYTWFVKPVRIWVRNEIPYEKVHSMGYGSTGFAQAPTNVLTELDLSIVPQEKCNSTLPSDESAPQGILTSQICAHDYEKNRDTCQGDSGGPLQLNLERRRRRHRNRRRFRYYLVGITSYGTYCRSEYPGVYTRVSSYIDWISSIVWPNYYQEYSNRR
ncbi:serine protease snake isoform X1 [Drosophila willistoni]|uniref:serine protease snake isoform X1 n=1 Tax=Drosophila willistoni TaxID=7260 RepID=UPI00017D8877|nr:serine protease snake isoform X1 [Drosophila willistoni]